MTTVSGPILDKWNSTGAAQGPLGQPTFDQHGDAGGGTVQEFQGGVIAFHPAVTGASVVGGGILEEWKFLGSGRWGYPTSDEQTAADQQGRMQTFRSIQDGQPEGSIVFLSDFGAHSLQGAIRQKWNALGTVTGQLRYPKADEKDAPFGGRIQEFAGGAIAWHPETEAFSTFGLIRDRWMAIGGPAWGYPITDETGTPDGRGRFNHYKTVQLEGDPIASIYFTPQTGAVEVAGAIWHFWADQGFEKGPMGYPVATEESGPNGTRVQKFEHGRLVWQDGVGVSSQPN
ncbi:hypothetical protein QA811_41340 [Streptomyces sp. B21-102]|uniref:hypothetical protein n=1 Tax=Streptomyces sp. B21-102 TaxID=3039416 RepID=UPI002FF0B9EE